MSCLYCVTMSWTPQTPHHSQPNTAKCLNSSLSAKFLISPLRGKPQGHRAVRTLPGPMTFSNMSVCLDCDPLPWIVAVTVWIYGIPRIVDGVGQRCMAFGCTNVLCMCKHVCVHKLVNTNSWQASELWVVHRVYSTVCQTVSIFLYFFETFADKSGTYLSVHACKRERERYTAMSTII